jgi:uncharacterized protein (DUF433 family)
MKVGKDMAAILDWSQCPAVESVPGRLSGAWVLKDTRMPVSAIFKNLEAGSDIDEIVEQFHVTREQVQAVLQFAARSLDAPPLPVVWVRRPMRVLFDHNIPSGTARGLAGDEVTEAIERGWQSISNGDLLAKAEEADFVFSSRPTSGYVTDRISEAAGSRLLSSATRLGAFCAGISIGLRLPWMQPCLEIMLKWTYRSTEVHG